MKKVILYILTAAAVFVFLSENVLAQEKKTYKFENFREVNVGWGMHVNIVQGSTYIVEVTADKEDLKVLKAEQKGDQVRFYIDKDWYRKKADIYIKIKMPLLTVLNLSGGSEGKITMNTSSKGFEGNMSGGSILNGELSCGDAEFNLSGGSSVDLSGKAGDLRISGSGGSIFDLKNYPVRNVDAELSGGSNATVKMNGTLNSDQNGGSQIVYYGNAKMGDTDFSGGSNISKGD